MPIRIGNNEVDDFRIGATQVDKIYLGSTELWTPSSGPVTPPPPPPTLFRPTGWNIVFDMTAAFGGTLAGLRGYNRGAYGSINPDVPMLGSINTTGSRLAFTLQNQGQRLNNYTGDVDIYIDGATSPSYTLTIQLSGSFVVRWRVSTTFSFNNGQNYDIILNTPTQAFNGQVQRS